MAKHAKLYSQALLAIEALFDDTSVPPEKTVTSLEDVRDEIEFKLSALAADKQRKESSNDTR
jgi:3'-phosphoadenosine 5'-phosphosulfate sulfotransferase (PAPS reductase)/FAD synthetase